jgi:hypothetical protein
LLEAVSGFTRFHRSSGGTWRGLRIVARCDKLAADGFAFIQHASMQVSTGCHESAPAKSKAGENT